MGRKPTQRISDESSDLGVARDLGLPLEEPTAPKVERTAPPSDALTRVIALSPPPIQQEVVVISMTTQTGRVRIASDLTADLGWNPGAKLHIEQTVLRKRLVGIPGLIIRPAKRGESVDTSLNSDGRIAIHRHHRAHLQVAGNEGRVLLIARAATPKTLLMLSALAVGSVIDEGWLS
jgi:hypothetical protein